jgi:hypothetical protein
MYCIFWIAFAICFVINLIKSGDGYQLFYKYVTFMNSMQQQPGAGIKSVSETKDTLLAEYFYKQRIYAVSIHRAPPTTWNDWLEVAVFKANHVDADGKVQPLKKTGKIQYLAGPFKNFHNSRDTPQQLNPKYLKLAFLYADNAVIHVDAHESIVDKLQRVRSQYDGVGAKIKTH